MKTRGLTNETTKGKTFSSKNEKYEKVRGKTTITEKNVRGSWFSVVVSCCSLFSIFIITTIAIIIGVIVIYYYHFLLLLTCYFCSYSLFLLL